MAKPIKTVWFDVDDVLVDTSALIEKSLRELTGKTIPVDTWKSHAFAEIYGLDESGIVAMRKKWREDQVLEKAPLRPGVVEAMRALADSGYALGLITARGWHEKGAEITMDMAAKHALPVSDLVIVAYDECKARRLLDLGVDVSGFVDDTYRHVKACLEQGWNALLMTQSWNERFEAPRVEGLDQFAGRILASATPRNTRVPA